MFQKIGLIGTGVMGTAVLCAVQKAFPDAAYYYSNRTVSKAEAFAAIHGGTVCTSSEVVRNCDVIFLAVKPKNLTALMDQLFPVFKSRKKPCLLVSMVTGFTAQQVQELSRCSLPVIRMIPNTPVATGSGVIVYCTLDTSADQEEAFCAAMAHAGLCSRVDESLLGMAGSLSGCGPAMVYMLIGSLADSAVAGGLSRHDAIRLAAQMVRGSAEMVLQSDAHPEELKDKVCSPGGTTIQMVRRLEEKGFRSAVFEALTAAAEATPKK